MIILVAGEKGGAGKTTIATNLAAMLASTDSDVLLFDADPQGTACEWAELRNNLEDVPALTTVGKTGKIHLEVNRLTEKYDHIVIDAGGRDSKEIRSALLVADVWVCPLQPSQFDLWTFPKMIEFYEAAVMSNTKLKPFLLPNSCSTHPSHNDAEEMCIQLQEIESPIPCMKSKLSERIAFRVAAAQGKSVTEVGKDTKAIQEIEDVYMEICNADN